MNDKDIFNKFYQRDVLKARLGQGVYREYLNNFFNADLKSFFKQKQINIIADLGCGDGRLEDFLINELKINKEFFGFDNSEAAIESAINRKIPNCSFIKQDCLKVVNDYENYFDALVMINVLHHLNDLSIIKDVYKLLKLGGSFLIIDLPWENVFRKVLFKIYDYSPQFVKDRFAVNDLSLDGKRPKRYKFTKEQLRNKIQQANFSIVSQEYRFLFLFLSFYLGRMLWLLKFPKKTIRTLFYPLFLASLEVEKFLLRFSFFQKQASIYKVICIKHGEGRQI